ncbi:MAG: T9SS type A sorting domain-containing protein [candidate division Zixibacteria bacterium]|nr:T9SS type A sorting domain-containing protein [candidate division Zixibacteria bacterium]
MIKLIALTITIMFITVIVSTVAAQIPYNTSPDWQSTENDDYGTGCGFDDIDADGFLDLAVSNGNDIIPAHNFVYINQQGTLPDSATWISDDNLYSGHCELGDINSDGYPDFIVSNYIGEGWGPGSIQIYMNIGGELETMPSWEVDSIYSFRASFGDADGDGDLDLAVATGESYNNILRRNLIFYNVDGYLDTDPGWMSTDYDAAYDIQFVDIDNDNDLDLAILPSGDPVKIYFNHGDSISTSPDWQASTVENGNSFDFADLNGDGYLDLGVANNNQLYQWGKFKIYFNDNGTLNSEADWESSTHGYGSEAVFSDVDNDSDFDLVAGRWWGGVYIYLNQNGDFSPDPAWRTHYSYQSVVENITFADVDNSAQEVVIETFPGDGQRQLFYLADKHIQGIDEVYVDGSLLALSDFCYHLKNGWISVADAPNDSFMVYYRNSTEKDMAVSNWDDATYLFYNHPDLGVDPINGELPAQTALLTNYPNPFNAETTIKYYLPERSHVKLSVYNLLGQEVAILFEGMDESGQRLIHWDASGYSSGVYYSRLSTDEGIVTGKMILLK